MRKIATSAAFSIALLVGGPARAQLHWDASAQVGAMTRFLSNAPPGGGGPRVGPVAEIHGHLALLPFLRVGPYLAHDISPMPGDTAAYQITSAGIRVKATSPVPLEPWRVWAFVGFGYAGAYGPSYHTGIDIAQKGVRQDTLATGAGGSFFELPAGLGAAYKVWRPWWLTAELSAHVGFGFTGSVFDVGQLGGRAGFTAGQAELLLQNPGTPTLSVSLAVGVMLDM